MENKNVCVYKVTNTVNNKIYIGQTSQIPTRRWSRHLRDAEKGLDLRFYRAIRKYGKDSFRFEVICENLTREEANQKEIEFISKYKSLDPDYGYNSTYGGLGSSHTEEILNKISKASLETWSDPEFRKRMSEAHKGLHEGEKNAMYGLHETHSFYGRSHTDETKNKISETRKILFQDEDFKKRMSEANIGKHHTDKGRKNISKSLEGNQHRKGIPHSDEIKKKISEGMKRRHAEKRQQNLDTTPTSVV